MRAIRLFLYGVPAALILLVVAAFINATFLSVSKKNEMSIGTIGEPSTLNPIEQADSAAGEVAGLIFNGLLKYDQNLNIVGDLATKWELSQETTFRFASTEEAAKAKSHLDSLKSSHPEWPITKMDTASEKLILELSQPGLHDSEEIWKAITQAGITPLPFPAITKGEKELPFLAEPIIHFTLRQGVRWHDGAPFTSADVAFTYHALIDERVASPTVSDYDLVSSLTTPTPYDVVVRYKEPFSPGLLSWMQSILPAHLLEKVDPAKWAEVYNRHPIGTGPFKFGEWKTNEYIRLVRNPDYYLGSPWLDSIVFRVLPDPLTLQLAFQTHQVDFWNAEPWAVKGVEKDPRFDIFSAAGNMYNYIGWNLQRPLFSDLRVRQALAQAVNIPQMIKYIIYGRGVQSTGIFTPKMWFFDPKVQPLTYDPAAARALLVQDDLKQVGVEVKVEIYEWAVMLTRFVNKGEFDAVVLGWGLSNDFDQYQIWNSDQTHPGELNFIHYSNPKVDHLLTDLRQEYSRPEILRMAGELQQTIYNDQPYTFLFVPESTSVMWKGSYRIRQPGQKPDEWIDSPVTMSKAGWNYNMEWFYRPEYPPGTKRMNEKL